MFEERLEGASSRARALGRACQCGWSRMGQWVAEAAESLGPLAGLRPSPQEMDMVQTGSVRSDAGWGTGEQEAAPLPPPL